MGDRTNDLRVCRPAFLNRWIATLNACSGSRRTLGGNGETIVRVQIRSAKSLSSRSELSERHLLPDTRSNAHVRTCIAHRDLDGFHGSSDTVAGAILVFPCEHAGNGRTDEANQLARGEGLAGRVQFEHRNAFDVDLRDVTVVTMWLYPDLMRLLRPIILERARPGTRVVTSTWDLATWPADQVDNDGTAIYMWIVPASGSSKTLPCRTPGRSLRLLRSDRYEYVATGRRNGAQRSEPEISTGSPFLNREFLSPAVDESIQFESFDMAHVR